MDLHLEKKHKYTNNYLSDVIFRNDFETSELIVASLDNGLKRDLATLFPEYVNVAINEVSINLSGGQASSVNTNNYIARFTNPEKQWQLDVASDHYVFISKKYIDHKDFLVVNTKIIEIITKYVPTINIKRTGFRYINQISIDEENPLVLNGYINKLLTTNFKFNPLSKDIIRSMTSTEYSIDEGVYLKFQYGCFNKQYPSKPMKKEFILDYDCYSSNFTKLSESVTFIDKYNTIMAKYFESSIEDKLRRILHEEK